MALSGESDMDESVLVSFVVPAYNAEKTIAVCLQSIQQQEYSNIEIIVVDDGSTDDTLNILRGVAEEDSRVIVISKVNEGVSSARNKGLENIKGKYVIFVDADDYISRSFVTCVMQQDESDFICFSLVQGGHNVRYDKDGVREIGKQIIYSQNDQLNDFFFSSPWSKCYSVDIIRNNNLLFDTSVSIGEDALFNLYYLDYISSLQCVSQKVYNYCENPESATRKFSEKILQADLNFQKQLNVYIHQRDEEEFQTVQVLSAMNGLLRCLNMYFGHVDNKNTLLLNYKKLKEFLNNSIYFEKYEKERKRVKETFGVFKFLVFEMCYKRRGIFVLSFMLKVYAHVRKKH